MSLIQAPSLPALSIPTAQVSRNNPDRIEAQNHYFLLFQALKRAAAVGGGLYHSPIQTASSTGPGRIERFLHIGPESDGKPIRLALFAGIRGTDRLSPYALANFLLDLENDPTLSTGAHLYAYPVTNVAGFLEHKPSLSNGNDPYLDLWQNSNDPATYLIERELSVVGFHGVIVLLGVRGLSGFSIQIHGAGATLLESVAAPAEAAAAAFLAAAESRDWAASQRLSLTAEGDLKPRPFELVIKVPSEAPALDQIHAWRAALREVVAGYRSFIAQAHHI